MLFGWNTNPGSLGSPRQQRLTHGTWHIIAPSLSLSVASAALASKAVATAAVATAAVATERVYERRSDGRMCSCSNMDFLKYQVALG